MKHRISKMEQAERSIVQLLSTGNCREGDPLPSVEILATKLHVCKNTVSQALTMLNRENVIVMSQGKTTRVTGKALKPHVIGDLYQTVFQEMPDC